MGSDLVKYLLVLASAYDSDQKMKLECVVSCNSLLIIMTSERAEMAAPLAFAVMSRQRKKQLTHMIS